MRDIAISANNLTKSYKLYDTPADRLREALHPLGKKYHRDFPAVRDMSFDIARGETVGIIGRNGAGKSTLLKIITGVLTPTTGSVRVHGRIASLLELGAGFNPEYTGIENIYLNATLMGVSRAEIDARLDAIVAFADIGDFIHQPVRLYSSGMFARLAFAVAINTDPDILIVDEALSVGDMKFQQKCFIRMKRFKEEGKTILLVTHDIHSLRAFASHTLWIEEGALKMYGTTESVSAAYISSMMYDQSRPARSVSTQTEGEWRPVAPGDYEIREGAQILGVRLANTQDLGTVHPSVPCRGDEPLQYSLHVRFDRAVESLMIGIAIVDRKGLVVAHLNTMLYDASGIAIDAGETYVFHFRFALPNLAKGYYSFYTNIVDGNYALNQSLAMVNGVCDFEVVPDEFYYTQLNGVVYLRDTHYFAEKVG